MENERAGKLKPDMADNQKSVIGLFRLFSVAPVLDINLCKWIGI